MQVGGTGSWATLKIPAGEELYTAQYDVEAYFYRLGIPAEIGRYFCLKEVPTWMVHKFPTPLDESPHGGAWFPYFRVVPMGWSWAMWIAQRVHVQAHIVAGFLPQTIVVDGQPPPNFREHRVIAMPYCDNGNVMSLNKKDAEEATEKVMNVLKGWGLGLQDITGAQLQAESLGVFIDGRRGRGIVRPTWARLSRVVAACEFMSRRPKVSSRQLERLVGRITYLSLLYRPLLSLLNAVYAFIRNEFIRPTRLWKSVARELWHMRCLLPFARTSLTLSSHPIVFATDASSTGMSVVSAVWPQEDVENIARWSERFRFGKCSGDEVSGRARALAGTGAIVKKALKSLEEDFVSEGNRDRGYLLPIEGFEEVPGRLVKQGWHQLFQCKWGLPEAIHVLEARGCTSALRHLTRSMSFRDVNVVILNDNLGVVMALSRGRSSHFALLQQCRRVLALSVCCGLTVSWRWIPSELNPADAGSREPSAPLSQLEFKGGAWATTGEAPANLEQLSDYLRGDSFDDFSLFAHTAPEHFADLSWLPESSAVAEGPGVEGEASPREGKEPDASAKRGRAPPSSGDSPSGLDVSHGPRRVLSLCSLLGPDVGPEVSGTSGDAGPGGLGVLRSHVHGGPPGVHWRAPLCRPPGLLHRLEPSRQCEATGILPHPPGLEATSPRSVASSSVSDPSTAD